MIGRQRRREPVDLVAGGPGDDVGFDGVESPLVQHQSQHLESGQRDRLDRRAAG